ncbi:hypothetical protein yc1106_06312 [Curvularia clavata]|uniref:Hydrophobin n=1 Tax=Curvularia clavata TaxID=95742 RepID=A0A9Q8ZF36_CURCL|nr:hypothetical protein yc1106_06312 [Curvularia clavata]
MFPRRRRPILGAAVVYGASRSAARHEIARQAERDMQTEAQIRMAEAERQRQQQAAIDQAVTREREQNERRRREDEERIQQLTVDAAVTKSMQQQPPININMQQPPQLDQPLMQMDIQRPSLSTSSFTPQTANRQPINMYTKVLVLALAALAVAGPSHIARQNQVQDQSKPTIHNKDSSCGKNSQVYCCNTQTADKLTGKGTLPINADVIDVQSLLGQCNELDIGLLPIDVLKKQCSQETVCCGSTKQQGVANFGCTTVHT